MLLLSGLDVPPENVSTIQHLSLIDYENPYNDLADIIDPERLVTFTQSFGRPTYGALKSTFLLDCFNLTEVILQKVVCSSASFLVACLMEMPLLRVIDMTRCRFIDDEYVGFAKAIARSAHCWKALQMVDLTKMRVTDECGLELVSHMCKHDTWTDLRLPRNKMGYPGLSDLLDTVKAELSDDKPLAIDLTLNNNPYWSARVHSFCWEREACRKPCYNVVFLLLCFGKFGGNDRMLTKDLFWLLARRLWKSRYNAIWAVEKKAKPNDRDDDNGDMEKLGAWKVRPRIEGLRVAE